MEENNWLISEEKLKAIFNQILRENIKHNSENLSLSAYYSFVGAINNTDDIIHRLRGNWRWEMSYIAQELSQDLRKHGVDVMKDGADKIRVCGHCHTPMKKGYYLDGEYACCEECAIELYNGDKAQFEEDTSHADEVWCETFYTEWESYVHDEYL